MDDERKPTLYYDIGRVPKTTELRERFMFPFSQINYLTNGAILDRITLLTSGTDNGKTTVASQILVSAIQQGYNTFAYFGEDGGAEARDRLYRQYLPYDRANFEYKTYVQNGKNTNTGEYFLTDDAWEKAHRFFNGKLFIYNNNIQSNKDNIIDIMEAARINDDCKVFLLDNVEVFDLDTDNENKGVKEICVALRQYAITSKVHIIIIAHIRKLERDVVRPDIQDVKGTSALTNIAKNIITIIRTDKLDKSLKSYRLFRSIIDQNGYNLDEADCVMEVRKTKGRGLGFCCLKYNKITNTYYECRRTDGKTEHEVKPVFTPEQPKSLYDALEVADDGELPF